MPRCVEVVIEVDGIEPHAYENAHVKSSNGTESPKSRSDLIAGENLLGASHSAFTHPGPSPVSPSSSPHQYTTSESQ
ncbi:hypothetical protein ECG_00544 [Echinococcus granulosus]|uniref:Uncharacterized protein n=1 Tax=Echinococcus granulosus TaxID=6210 RepID=U6IXT1_ECHGR|nr:hypothetical protein EGR_00486 [Echinococcus granulosus]EUB64536.1 hypothetical protein EGR_00486 [Echinococcus granulosus]KAH9286751.1 hypothetical protein ECG_00544 [Echinococcus granulosus]CDS16610.1 hypothetical protein EgrG_002021000 [Echinococcus granulosus]